MANPTDPPLTDAAAPSIQADAPTPLSAEQAQALRTTRLRWLIPLLISLPMPFVALPLTGSDWLEQQPSAGAIQALAFALLEAIGVIMAGMFIRNQTYKAHWQGEVVTPYGYLRANTFFFAAVAVASLSLLIISVAIDYPAPTFAAAPVIIGLLLMNFPNAKPMRPAPLQLGTEQDHSIGMD